VELSEIESVLESHEQIREAIVITKGEGVEKILCAYYVSFEEDPDKEVLKAYLSARLPSWMIPVSYTRVDKFLLTPNGKADRKSLPDPEVSRKEVRVSPRNETEKKIINIWAEVLQTDSEQISIADNFFEIGGNSLSILKVYSKLKNEYEKISGVEILFQYPTIERLTRYLDETITANDISEELSPDSMTIFNESINILLKN
jgi:acyl carrier protein